MPYKNPEDKKRRMKLWRKRCIENGYGKWLYARRSLRFQDAEHFRTALEQIEALGDHTASVIAREALLASGKRWDALPDPPRGSVEKAKEEPRDDTLFEALEKLGLSN